MPVVHWIFDLPYAGEGTFEGKPYAEQLIFKIYTDGMVEVYQWCGYWPDIDGRDGMWPAKVVPSTVRRDDIGEADFRYLMKKVSETNKEILLFRKMDIVRGLLKHAIAQESASAAALPALKTNMLEFIEAIPAVMNGTKDLVAM